ncbi:MAG: ABC transporter ATP-binding protein [Blautia sp.]|nr:ABC transporter ATP-binding protein [Blautia sp.]
MNSTAISIRDVCKEYRLGQIGGTTLQHELQSWWARKRGKEDPNLRIGKAGRAGAVGQRFLALDHINLEIAAGEALGIIGRNGAGKSTLLKLLCGVTAPTSGDIDIYGRVASMLEVGTGFHSEMTGRENIYMNGAILGMTRREIDAKLDEIIAFSEIAEFIDTPVKRYSSGMYVKLAFSVAAHLDSEILIMDEVLAVGDMLFQRKCLEKMRQEAGSQGKTVLYVSHNMGTIRQLCDRCVVLDEGKLLFVGDTEEAIALYMKSERNASTACDLSVIERKSIKYHDTAMLLYARYPGRNDIKFTEGEKVRLELTWRNNNTADSICIRFEIWTLDDVPQASFVLRNLKMDPRQQEVIYEFTLDLSEVVPGEYKMKYTLFYDDEYGNTSNADSVTGLHLEVVRSEVDSLHWDPAHWGYIHLRGAEAERIK